MCELFLLGHIRFVKIYGHFSQENFHIYENEWIKWHVWKNIQIFLKTLYVTPKSQKNKIQEKKNCHVKLKWILFRRRAKLSVKKKNCSGRRVWSDECCENIWKPYFSRRKTGRISFSCRKTIFLFFFFVRLFRRKNNVVCDIKFEKYRFVNFPLKNTLFLTSWYVVPVGSVDDVVVPEEVFVVAGPPVWVGHHLVK